MQSTILNVVIGASTLKIICSEKKDTDIIINSSLILTSGSKLFLNEKSINFDLIEDRLRLYMLESNIKKAGVNFSLPDYVMPTVIASKDKIYDNSFISSLVKSKNFEELLDENVENEYQKTLDCQIIYSGKYNSTDNDGFSDLAVTYYDTELIKGLKKMCKRLKLVPMVLESESASLIRLIDMFEVKDNYMLIDVGDIYAKIITLTGTSGLKVKHIPSGLYKIDAILASFRGSNIALSRQQRVTAGMIAFNDMEFNIVKEYIQKNFSVAILDELSAIYENYHGFHYIKNFFVTGGAWSYFEFKETIQEQTLDAFSDDVRYFETFETILGKNAIFGNPIVERDIRDNICLFASCVGLTLRGGI